MLTRDELVSLYQTHMETPILSVYIDADQHDPAERDVWRTHLKQGVSAARKKLSEAGGAGRPEDFERALERIESAIGVDGDSFLPGRGWVGFASADELIHAGDVPAPMPNLVRWENGLRVAPYVRALKQARPVMLVVLDRRKAALYRYQQGELERVEDLHADTFVGDLTDIGTAKRATKRSGIRGKTGTDAAQAVLDNAADRLVNRIASELLEEDEGYLIVGGTPEQMAALIRELPDRLADHIAERPSLNFDMSEAELTGVLEEAASELSAKLHERLLDETVDLARSNGRGCLGRSETESALRAQRVRTLLVSAALMEKDPDYADRLTGTAFGSNGADVHLLTRDTGGRLDEIGEGVCAALHY